MHITQSIAQHKCAAGRGSNGAVMTAVADSTYTKHSMQMQQQKNCLDFVLTLEVLLSLCLRLLPEACLAMQFLAL